MAELLLYLRVNEVHTPVKPSMFGGLHIAVQSSMTDFPETAPLVQENVLLCNSIWKFKVSAIEIQRLVIILKKARFMRSKQELAKVVIPLAWFPIDKTVRQWFPMKAIDGKQTNILLDIHIDTQKARPFLSELGTLLVKPLWAAPSGPQSSPSRPAMIPNQASQSILEMPGSCPLVMPESVGCSADPIYTSYPQVLSGQYDSDEPLYHEAPYLPVAMPPSMN